MIKLFELTVEHVTRKFNLAQIPGTGKLTPRNGFYHVIDFEFRDINQKHTQIPVIKAHWKENQGDPFIKDAVFEIALSSLVPANENQKFDYSDLIGKTIQVFNMSISYFAEYPKGRIQGKWMFDLRQPKIISSTALTLGAISLITVNGILKVEGDEDVDYEEEANRLDASNYIVEDPEQYDDWDVMEDACRF